MSDLEICQEESVDAHRSELNLFSNHSLLETSEEHASSPKSLLSLPIETLLQIIGYLSYRDRFRLKMIGNHNLIFIERLAPRAASLRDYRLGYTCISGKQGTCGPEGGDTLELLRLASAVGHHALILKLLENEYLRTKSTSFRPNMLRGRHCIHDCLEQAVSHSQVCMLNLLLEISTDGSNCFAEKSNWYGYILDDTNTLEYAAGNGHIEIVHTLLDHGAHVRIRTGYPSPIGLAARNGHEAIVRLLVGLLEGNVEELLPPDLSEATANGHLSILRFLLELGVRPRPNPKGLSPLHLAAKGGHLGCIKALLEYGTKDCLANCNDHISHIHYENWSCLHFAVVNGHFEIVKFLLNRGHLDEIPTDSHRQLVPLAAMEGEFEIVKILIENGLDVHGKYNEETSLHLAVMGDFPEIISLLLENGANASSVEGGKELQTPLHKVAATGSYRATSILLSSTPDLNIQDIHGQTPLHIAIHNGHILVTDLLLKAGADPTIISKALQSPLNIAIKQGDEVSVSLFLFHCTTTNFDLTPGDPPLHTACIFDKPQIVSMLLSHGVDMEALDSLGRRAIHVAASHGGFGSLLHLLAANVDRHATSLDGKTAMHFAAEAGKQGSVRVLLEWGLEKDVRCKKGMTPIQYALHTKRFVSHRIVLRLLSDGEDDKEGGYEGWFLDT